MAVNVTPGRSVLSHSSVISKHNPSCHNTSVVNTSINNTVVNTTDNTVTNTSVVNNNTSVVNNNTSYNSSLPVPHPHHHPMCANSSRLDKIKVSFFTDKKLIVYWQSINVIVENSFELLYSTVDLVI